MKSARTSSARQDARVDADVVDVAVEVVGGVRRVAAHQQAGLAVVLMSSPRVFVQRSVPSR